MSIFDAIRECITAKEAAEMYGLSFRGKRARCPWHDDTHPDLAFYQDGTCWCYACHHGGDAAALTAQVFGLSMREAARKLNADFGLSLDTEAPVPQAERNRIAQERAARLQEQDKQRQEWAFLCRVRREADRAVEKAAARGDLAWDDPAFVRALAVRSRADNEMDRIGSREEGTGSWQQQAPGEFRKSRFLKNERKHQTPTGMTDNGTGSGFGADASENIKP